MASFLNMDGGVVSSVMAEPELHTTGPQWPEDNNTESLVTELLTRSSNIYVRIKRHTRNVQKFMHFLNEGTSSMPKGLLMLMKNLSEI